MHTDDYLKRTLRPWEWFIFSGQPWFIEKKNEAVFLDLMLW